MSIVGLLVALVIICLLFWAVTTILRSFGIGDPMAGLVKVVFMIVVVLWALSVLGYAPMLRLR